MLIERVQKNHSDPKDTSARRRPIRLSDVVNRPRASDGDEVSTINLSSSSLRKLTLHSWSRSRRRLHSWRSFVFAVFACSILCFSFCRCLWKMHGQEGMRICTCHTHSLSLSHTHTQRQRETMEGVFLENRKSLKYPMPEQHFQKIHTASRILWTPVDHW